MRCRYCFQEIPDRSDRCPHCGSRLPAGQTDTDTPTPTPATTDDADSPLPPLTGRQMVALVGGVVLLAACLCLGGLVLFSPGLLPQPVVAAMPFLASPTPLPTLQVTRATIATPTPAAWERHVNRRAGISVDFPAGWVVVDQGRPGWQRRVDALDERYDWAATLFEADVVPFAPRTRALDPAGVDLDGGRAMLVTVGETDLISPTLGLDALVDMARDEPETVADVVGLATAPAGGYAFANRRTDQVQLAGEDALLVEFLANADLAGETVRVRTRAYFIPQGDAVTVLCYYADEQTLLDQSRAFERIVDSFALDE